MISVTINWEMNLVRKEEKIQILVKEGMNKFQATLDERKISKMIDEIEVVTLCVLSTKYYLKLPDSFDLLNLSYFESPKLKNPKIGWGI